ncbi:hypothetical protein [Mycolicibacterium vanbaalenii]|uniref:Uncharacterized protein n=1 Tax=Mycolicibacterium vanbaalenii (strain DSM 7251 / JCM 13017 / BCRC 16820 / KCTC 9966 / NRRL B-24157 / PYR-1) TaxID=350058 RepID=A1T436_MYCVP|nr:hypothetical protein [Mycolicibacterium vanbaalenii]ABM11936.1 conserved hypothetical protein [Mycolicibacterium vanbaalenii PYR-1]MCV7130028.1 hypothetical protein [Mycolicibacterium vanbaalenii PYR-1]
MDNGGDVSVPVWTLATEEVDIPDIIGTEAMTPARLSELRAALAALAGSPIATLEAHPITAKRPRNGGIALHASSPLAQNLTQLVAQTAKATPSAANAAATGEVLYRMVVPAKVAAQVSKGLVSPMASKAAAGGVRSALMGSKGIAAHASFVPVAGKSALAGAATGSAGTAGIAAAGAGALTVAAPLVLMALAVGASAYADHQRQQALEHITELLEKLHHDKLDEERNRLDGCRDAIEKATAILLDQGRIGATLGLDATVYEVNVAIERAKRRLGKWQKSLDPITGPVELGAVLKAFPGLTEEDGGEFRAHLELANLAIALKRRILVLQAVEHSQLEGAQHPFERFMRTLQSDERGVNELEAGILDVIRRLSTLELKRRGGVRSVVLPQGEVDDLLRAIYRLRALGDEFSSPAGQSDVAIEIERSIDGSVVVFPAVSALND